VPRLVGDLNAAIWKDAERQRGGLGTDDELIACGSFNLRDVKNDRVPARVIEMMQDARPFGRRTIAEIPREAHRGRIDHVLIFVIRLRVELRIGADDHRTVRARVGK